jgi:hypothetical protein
MPKGVKGSGKPADVPPEETNQYVSQEKFDKLVDAVGELAELIKSKPVDPVIQRAPEAPSFPKQPINYPSQTFADKVPTTAERVPVPAEWNRIVDEILGADFDRWIVYPASGDVLLKISVPREKSNALPNHWDFYKIDIRTKAVGKEGIEGVRKHCQLVKQNLSRGEQPKY